jgi:hypothetical protein
MVVAPESNLFSQRREVAIQQVDASGFLLPPAGRVSKKYPGGMVAAAAEVEGDSPT